MAGGGAYEKEGGGIKTYGCRDRWGTLQYRDHLSGTYRKRYQMGSRGTAGDGTFYGVDRVSRESFRESWEGTGSPGLIRWDPAERAGNPAGTVLSYRLEKSDIYGLFLRGRPFFDGNSCEAADDRENTVSGSSFLK